MSFPRWVPDLPKTFEQYNLKPVIVDAQRERPELRKFFMDLTLLRIEERAANYWDVMGPPGSGDQHRERARVTLQEVEQGAGISEILQVTVGRKHQ